MTEPITALVPRSIVEAETMAVTLAKAGLLPEHFRGKPADVFWAISFGLEVGLGPVASLNSVYVVHGRPGLYADAMAALVLTSPACKYFRKVSSDDTQATYETLRVGDPEPETVQVTLAQAERAGWAKQNAKYSTEPRRMLEARAKSWLARSKYPDVLRGIAAVEELRDDADMVSQFKPAPVVIDAEVMSAPPETPAVVAAKEHVEAKELLGDVLAATSLGALEDLLPRLGKVPKTSPAYLELRTEYRKAKERLTPRELPAESPSA